MADIDYNMLLSIILIFVVFSVFTTAAAKAYPNVSKVTGVKSPSDIDACTVNKPTVPVLLQYGTNTSGLDWPTGGLLGNAQLDNVEIQNQFISLQTNETQGSYTVPGLTFSDSYTLDKIGSTATVPTSTDITYSVATDNQQLSYSVPDGSNNESVSIVVPEQGTGTATLQINMSRTSTADPSPVMDTTAWYGLDSNQTEAQLNILQKGNCAVQQVANMFSWTVHSSGNFWIDTILLPFQIIFVLLLLAAIVNIASVLPFIG